MTEALSRGQQLARWGALRVRYAHPAERVGADNRVSRGFLLRLWLGDRLRPGRPTVAQQRSAWVDAGYCIDAPTAMPAGACRGLEMDGADPEDPVDARWLDHALPLQIEVRRDGE